IYPLISSILSSNIQAQSNEIKDNNIIKVKNISEYNFSNGNNQQSLLKISLQHSMIPESLWGDICELTEMWDNIVKNNDLRSYKELCENLSISKERKNNLINSFDYQLLSSLSLRNVQDMISNNDFDSLLTYLNNKGFISSYNSKSLIEYYESSNDFKEKFTNELIKQQKDNLTDDDDIIFIINNIKSNPEVLAAAAAAVIVIIAVGVMTYVATAINVMGVVNVAVQAAVAVNVAVTVSSHGGNCNSCHQSVRDSIGINNVNVIDTVSAFFDNPHLKSRAYININKLKAKASLDAAINLGYITINKDKYDDVINSLDNIIEKSIKVGF
ncbi:hypothetical protein, partial [Photobacterium kishitanii]